MLRFIPSQKNRGRALIFIVLTLDDQYVNLFGIKGLPAENIKFSMTYRSFRMDQNYFISSGTTGR